jgi:hypothetical protein
MTDKLFETALGIGRAWYVAGGDFDAAGRKLTIRFDLAPGFRPIQAWLGTR